jgi:subtilisin family serine protease
MRVQPFFKKREVIIIMVIVLAASISLLLAQTVFNPDYAGITESQFSQNADSILRPDYIEGEVLVKFKPGVDMSTVDSLVDSLFFKVERRFPALSRVKGQAYALVKSNHKTTQQVMTELAGFPEVEEVSPNYRVYADAVTPNDPRFSELWGLHNTGQSGGTADIDIDAPEAWAKTTGSSEVIVAVIDTGIDYYHPDLLANLWVNPYEIEDGVDNDGNGYIDDIHGIDAITLSGDPMDDNGHGTHCSGTIGAVGNNGQGVAGVNWNVRLMGTKFLNSSGSGSNANAITCIDYIIEEKTTYGQDIGVINASWGGGSFDQNLKDAIDAAGELEIVFCAAAGNDGTNNDTSPHYPSSYTSSNIIAVTAVNHSGTRYYNYGLTSVDLGAPGVSILSTVRCSYTPQPGDIFFDNMEGGGNLWTHGGTLDSWGITNAASGGLENYWTDKSYGNFRSDSPGTGYIHNVNSWLATANDIDLSPYIGQPVYLCFDGGFQFDYFKSNDTAAVEVSTDGGSNWNTLVNLGSLYYGYGYYYLKQTYVIPDLYKTANFRFRFHITTDDTDYSYYGYKNRGWIIDNIGIDTNVTCGYEYKNGTSMATPHVTGAVAFIAAYYPEETAAERITRILSHVVPLSSLSGKCVTGGLLNLDLALDVLPSTLILTSPNGGENLEAGSSHHITWTSTGGVGNVKIQYSTDSGTTWLDITTSTANDGNFTWTVPNTPSSACLVRISEIDDSPADVSNTVFTITDQTQRTITVTSPNGGENLGAGASREITWTTSGTFDSLVIQYSGDGGISWRTIVASTENDGSYLWTVPVVHSPNCLVRIAERNKDNPSDTSDEVFSIIGPTISVVSPNGGESFTAGTVQPIAWTTTGSVGKVSIAYSVDGGKSWTIIAEDVENVENSGSFSWTVPNQPSEHCLVQIKETDNDETPADTSDGKFSILPPTGPTITVLYPNGGESFFAGDQVEMTWTGSQTIANVEIAYSPDNGLTWTGIITSTPNDGKYQWKVPGISSDQVLIQIRDTDGEPSDTSDGVFSILLPTSLTITSPNGGETLYAGTSHEITWNWTGSIAKVDLEYSPDGGKTWNSIAVSVDNDGSYDWNVPGTPSQHCLVRVSEGKSDTHAWDVSNSEFTIDASSYSSLTVISPNGGETLYAGSSFEITWTSIGISGDVKIDYSYDQGSTWERVVESTANNGSYTWTVPGTPSSVCLVRVGGTGGNSTPVSDESDAVFEISTGTKPTLTVIAPNGGETLYQGSVYEITWAAAGSIDKIAIEFSTDGGLTWEKIAAAAAVDGRYQWTVPETPASVTDSGLVRISGMGGDLGPWDVSDAVFSIMKPEGPALTVTSPNGGERLMVDTTHEITWTTTGEIEAVMIEYSLDRGLNWVTVTESTANQGSYEWTVPGTLSENCLVRVRGIDNDKSPSDTSDKVFSIVPWVPTITVTYPNGGETFYADSIKVITWSGSPNIDNVMIEYSTDNGAAWSTITGSIPNTGSYEWTVPQNSSVQCLVRVSALGSSGVSDVSDAVFSIVIETYNCGFQGIAWEKYPNGGYGPPIPGVEITFVSEDGSLTKRTTTNSSGYYKISLKPQRYVVSTKHPDYQDYTTAPGFFVVTGNGYQTGNFFLTRK